MTFKGINERFSEIVGEYLAKGYTINAGTMSGTQGEIAKVDVTNGKEILRILMENHIHVCEPTTVDILVGRCTDKVRPHCDGIFNTVWRDHLVEVYRETYYALDRHG